MEIKTKFNTEIKTKFNTHDNVYIIQQSVSGEWDVCRFTIKILALFATLYESEGMQIFYKVEPGDFGLHVCEEYLFVSKELAQAECDRRNGK